MATLGTGGAPYAPPSPNPATSFKGHPQPLVNERLEACKIFLADEDADRCLDFASRLAQINEYITHIKEEKLDCDADLFHDVEVMAGVHVDWQMRQKRGLGDAPRDEKPAALPISTRLVDAKTTLALDEEREATGIGAQMREDHPPFTVARRGDEPEFLRSLMKDSMADSETVDRDKNLLWVESRAYNWAIREPALIPYWMQPVQGLPKTGVKDIDALPWYRRIAKSSEVGKNRPFRPWLPDYLIARENEINRILKSKKGINAEFSKLEKLLRLHEPLDVKELRERWKQQLAQNGHEENDTIEALKNDYITAQNAWIDTFRLDGVYLMESREGVQSTQPGVFYLPGSGAITADERMRAKTIQGRLDPYMALIRQKGSFNNLNDKEKYDLNQILIEFAPTEFKSFHNTGPFSHKSPGDPLVARWTAWVDSLAPHRPQVCLLRPGEMEVEGRGLLCIPWDFPPVIPDIPVPEETDPENTIPEHRWLHPNLMKIEDKINEILQKEKKILEEGGVSILGRSKNGEDLFKLLSHCLPPHLVKLKNQIDTAISDDEMGEFYWDNHIGGVITAERRQRGRSSYLAYEFSEKYRSWVRGLIWTGVRLKIKASRTKISEPDDVLYWNPSQDYLDLGPQQIHSDRHNLGFKTTAAPDMHNILGDDSSADGPRASNDNQRASDTVNDILRNDRTQASPQQRRTVSGNIDQLKSQINKYLVNLNLGLLNRTDYICLCEDLRLFMPAELWRSYDETRNLDQKARTTMLADHERACYHEKWIGFRNLFIGWIKTFGQRPIRIFKGRQSEVTVIQPNTLYLQVEGEEAARIRPRLFPTNNLPLHIKELATQLSSLLSRDGQLDTAEKSQVEILLCPLWQPVKKDYRKLLMNKITTMGGDPSQGLTPEEAVLLESRMTQGYVTWKALLADGAQHSEICLVDRGMDVWDIELDRNIVSPQAAQFSPEPLDVSQHEFLRIAEQVRKQEPLSDAERHRLCSILQPVSLDQLNQMEEDMAQKVVDYWGLGADGKRLDFSVQVGMQDLDTLYLWQKWGTMNETMRKQVILEAQVPDPIQRLLNDRSFTQQGPIQAVLNENERQELEIEINNLLIRSRKGESSCGHEKEKLDYLLRPLAGDRLLALKRRIERLRADLRETQNYDTTSCLMLVELVKEFDAGLEIFKVSIPGHGIFLDTWWYKQDAIDDVYRLSLLWNEALEADPNAAHRNLCTGDKVEDDMVSEWHDHYTILKAYAHRGEVNNGEEQARLILHAMPQHLRLLNEKVKDLRKLVDSMENRKFGANLWLVVDFRNIKEEFIKEYMGWYTGLARKEIEAFRNAIAMTYSGHVDFTNKAERRGIQRAAIELAFNLLATNQEQHRPNDRFRIIQLPPQYHSPQKETALSLPLEPSKRPVEQDTFEYTKKILAYQRWKDFDYHLGRTHSINARPGELPAPINYNGPFVAATGDDFKEGARDRQSILNNYYAILSTAEKASPRPLLQQMLLCATEALTSDPSSIEAGDGQLLQRLTQRDLDLIEELAGPPWDELRQDYTDDVLDGDEDEQQRLYEFERDVEEAINDIPFWQLPVDPTAIVEDDPDVDDLCAPVHYNPQVRSETGIEVRVLVQNIRNTRLAKSDGQAHIWTDEEASRYLEVMSNFYHIHFDKQNGLDTQVSRVPLIGHPENKYVLTRQDAKSSPGVHYVFEGDKLRPEVQYNSQGFMGPPIVQPNMYEHFLDLATRLGREIRTCLQTRQIEDWDPRICVRDQVAAMTDALRQMAAITPEQRAQLGAKPASREQCDISLESMALELNKIAPDLAEEAGFDWSDSNTFPDDGTEKEQREWLMDREKQAGALLQMQVLEEASNNWESRFPENEHVWDFAESRLETVPRTINGRTVDAKPRIRQFFSMLRYPLGCQSQKIQNLITASGPKIQEKPTPPTQLSEETSRSKKKAARHLKGRRPHFDFGETQYQKAYLGHRMKEILKDVPEFQPKPIKRGFFSKEEPYGDSFALPEIPKGWKPDNVSKEEKRRSLIEFAKSTPGFPDHEILEYYHTSAEINAIKRQRAWEKDQAAIQKANEGIEQRLKKKMDEMTGEGIDNAQTELNIDHFTEEFLPSSTAAASTIIAGGTAGQGRAGKGGAVRMEGRRRRGLWPPVAAESPGGPARNTRSKSPKKRSALDASAGQKSRKKSRFA